MPLTYKELVAVFSVHIIMFCCISECCAEMMVPVLVNRRSKDLVTYSNTSRHEVCDTETFLVNERRCVSNRDLLEG